MNVVGAWQKGGRGTDIRRISLENPDVEARIRKALDYKGEIEFVTRDELYARAKRAFAVVQTGETAKYGNVFVKKGVTPVG